MDTEQPELPPVESREIPGFSAYLAGVDGSLWSRKRGLRRMTPNPHKKDGRSTYALYRDFDGKRIRRFGAQWVLLAFAGPCPNGMESCHNDGDFLNDSFGNLRYDTHLGNIQDKARQGTGARGETHGAAKLCEKDVMEIRRLHSTGEATAEELLETFGVSRTTISFVVNRKRWKHLE